MITSFANRGTEDIYDGVNSKRAGRVLPKYLHEAAKRKLDMLDSSTGLLDLRMPPSNHLEALSGNLEGFYSIRINNQWRIIFQWSDLGASSVEIIDYH